MKTGNKIEVILGIVVVFYIIADTLPQAFEQISNISSDGSGVTMLKLLPLVAGIGILYAIYRSTMGKNN